MVSPPPATPNNGCLRTYNVAPSSISRAEEDVFHSRFDGPFPKNGFFSLEIKKNSMISSSSWTIDCSCSVHSFCLSVLFLRKCFGGNVGLIVRRGNKNVRIFNGTFLWLLNDFFKYSSLASSGPRISRQRRAKKFAHCF